MKTAFPHLFQPFQLGDLQLPNRIVMAPMTRCMATDDLVPSAETAAYYARRAAAGLLITEATIIRPDGQGYPHVPGIFTPDQAAGWRRVCDAVHQAGGRIFMQLWHVGRVSHPHYLAGQQPVAPSAVALSGAVSRAKHLGLEYGMPRELTVPEIEDLVACYARAAKAAVEAGCDGVELHGANGYLIDQFLHAHTNRRDDAYGGSVAGRTRFPLEVVDATIAEVGASRVGLRLSPAAYFFMEHDARDVPTFQHLIQALQERGLAYLHTGIFDDHTSYDYLAGRAGDFLRRHHCGTLVGCGSYTPQEADAAIGAGRMDLVAFGRPFLANPDLVDLLARGQEARAYDSEMLETLY